MVATRGPAKVMGALGRARGTRTVAFDALRVHVAACAHFVEIRGRCADGPDVTHGTAAGFGAIASITHGLVREAVPWELLAASGTRPCLRRHTCGGRTSDRGRQLHLCPVHRRVGGGAIVVVVVVLA